MCGRFFLNANPIELAEVMGINVPEEHVPSYNIAPSHKILIIPNTVDRTEWFAKWTLIPSWSKEPKVKYSTINARSETAHVKPVFRASVASRRCLIPASGFYEWMKLEDGSKQPYAIQMEDQKPFAFAGLWEVWHHGEDDEILSCAIMTTKPNERVAKVHDRMPVILRPEHYDLWLDPGKKSHEELSHVYEPYPAEEMMTFAVNKAVGSPANNHEGLLQPIQV